MDALAVLQRLGTGYLIEAAARHRDARQAYLNETKTFRNIARFETLWADIVVASDELGRVVDAYREACPMIAESYRIPSLDGGWVEVDISNGRTTVKVIGPVVRAELSGPPVVVRGRAAPTFEYPAVRDWVVVEIDADGARSIVSALEASVVQPKPVMAPVGHPGASGGILATVRRVQ